MAKTLAIRLESLPDIIAPSQHAFLPGRQITDCFLLVNEWVDAMRKVDWDGIVCKIDLEKAMTTSIGAILIGFWGRWVSMLSGGIR